MSVALAPSAPRKASGAGSSASGGVDAESSSAAASLFFFSRAARWLTLEAAKVFFARLEGFSADVRAFGPAAVGATALTAATGVEAVTSAKDLSPRTAGGSSFSATAAAVEFAGG